MKLTNVTFRISGLTPLMINKFRDDDQMAATAGSRGSSAARERLSPEEEAESRLYIDEEGDCIMPQPNILASVIQGGSYFKIGQRKITTTRQSLIPAAVAFLEPYYPIETEGGWSVDSRPVRIPATGGRILRHRPIFWDWSIDLEAQLDVDEIRPDLFREIIDAAGSKSGIGDFRPSTRGPFGRYRVDTWAVE